MIVVDRFSKMYSGLLAVDELSFRVRPGEVLGLVGRNGAGKTTTLRSLAGIIPATSGSLAVNGFDVGDAPVAAKQITAYVADDPQLFHDLSVEQHLRFAASVYRIRNASTRIDQLLEAFELTAKRHVAASNLSRGMRQKLGICSACLSEPRALLLDEPLTGLDPQAIRILKETIRDLAGQGTAVIISSHLLAMVEDLCTHVLILDAGQARFFGTLAELRVHYPENSTIGGETTLEHAYFAALQSN